MNRPLDPALDAWLEAGAGGGEPASTCRETPIAKVYVFKGRVLKVKKPVDFGFLDFSTVQKREWAARRELDFNRATAPDVYRAVHAIVRDGAGFRLNDREGREPPGGEVADWAVEMRPFDPDAILASHPDRIDAPMAERLGRTVADAHARAAPIRDVARGAAGLAYVIGSNAEQLRSLADRLSADGVEALIADTRTGFDRLAALLDARRDAGFVRRCHGDLHLGNVVAEAGRPVLFDCIEFSDALSEIDVLYDLAFLLMDLTHHGRVDAANRALNAWADQAGRAFGRERLVGLATLPLFLSVRAAVRAHVKANGGETPAARGYLKAAASHLKPCAPRLLAVGGRSGSGKSTLVRALAPRVGSAPGALALRSDEVRKRLFGAGPTDRLPKSAYGAQVSPRVYAAMLDEARAALSAGWPVVLDAAFLRLQEREDAQTLAQALGVPFTGLWTQAPADVLRARVAARTGDASDADAGVLATQLAQDVGPIAWRRLDARQPPERLADAVLEDA